MSPVIVAEPEFKMIPGLYFGDLEVILKFHETARFVPYVIYKLFDDQPEIVL